MMSLTAGSQLKLSNFLVKCVELINKSSRSTNTAVYKSAHERLTLSMFIPLGTSQGSPRGPRSVGFWELQRDGPSSNGKLDDKPALLLASLWKHLIVLTRFLGSNPKAPAADVQQ